MTTLSIRLLGPLQVALDDALITDFATDKARALLAYLAVESDHPHRRDALAGLLWPDEPQGKARRNLRVALYHLRQAIADQDEGNAYLHVSRQAIQFNARSDHWLDVAAFASLAEACRDHRHRRPGGCLVCLRRMERMVALYRGEFLEQFFLSDSDVFEEWAVLRRERFHQEVVTSISHLAAYCERRGDLTQAVRYARRLIELEPWREEAHRQLMRLLWLDGQRSAALAQFETCQQALGDHLGVEPTIETTALYERISEPVLSFSRAESGDLVERSASQRALANLPPSPTAFVGREAELAELADDLADPDCRLLTLAGPGGIGKTRLALQAARNQIGAFAHGVFHTIRGWYPEGEKALNLAARTLSTLEGTAAVPGGKRELLLGYRPRDRRRSHRSGDVGQVRPLARQRG